MPLECHAGDSVDLYVGLGPGTYVGGLSLAIIGCYPHVGGVYDIKQRLSRLHELSHLNLLARGKAVAGGKDEGVGKIQLGCFEQSLCEVDSGIGLSDAVTGLVDHCPGGGALSAEHFIAGFFAS